MSPPRHGGGGVVVAEVAGYVLRERIGSGANATVWRGEAVGAPGRVVAIRLVPHTEGRPATEALEHEAELLGRLSHPHILPVLAVVPTSDGLALVTSYASGGSLAAVLDRGSAGPDGSDGASADVVADLGSRLASALAAVHGAGIVHRGIRPANVLFDRERRPLLADVGVARLYGDVRALTGTAPYLDPGLTDGRAPDARSDLYALGITLYEALAGAPPYAGATSAQTVAAAERARFVPLADRVQAPPALTAVIEAAFARDPRDRPDGASEFAGQLEEIRRTMDDDGPSPQAHATGGRAGVLGAVPSPARTPSRTRRPERHTPPPPDVAPSSSAGSDTSSASATVDEAAKTPRHRSRMMIAAAAAVVLVPTGVMLASFQDEATDTAVADDATAAADPDRADSADDGPEPPTPEPGNTTQPPVEPTIEREPAPPCDGMPAPDDGREILLADLEGAGCSAVIAWDGQRLEVLGSDGSVERYDLGARAGDLLRFGDWSCDGRDTPALYRPADGRVFTFDEIAPGARTTATGAPTGTIEGVPTVVTDAAGCDRLEVEP